MARKGSLGNLYFDAGDSMETKTLTGLTTATTGTIAFWFKHLNPSATELVGFAISRDASSTQTEFFWDCDNQVGAKRIYMLLKVDGTTQWVANTGVNSLTTLGSGWHHFAVTHNATTAAYFIDGVPYTTTFTTSTDKTKWLNAILTDATSDADTLIVGALARNGSNLVPFNGNIGELRIYTRVLSNAEILSLYQRNSVDTTNLQLELLLNEGSGLTANDSSVNGNDLTLAGGAATPTWQNVRSTAITRTTASARLTASARSAVS